MTLFLDTNIFIYAFGDESVYREPCRQILESVARGDTPAVTSTEVVQDVAYRYLKRGEAARAVEAIDGVLATVEAVLPVDIAVVRRFRHLVQEHPRAGGRDLIHVAVMMNAGIDTIASADRDFDRFPRIKRTDPLDA